MPGRRYKKNYRRKPYAKRSRKYGRRGRKSSRSLAIGRLPRGFGSAPFPAVMYKVLSYTDDTARILQTVSDLPKYIEYRGNSLRDPDLTGIGSQPRYFDTLCGAQDTAAPYRNYNVLASKIIIDIYQDPSVALGGQAATLFVVPTRGTAVEDNVPDDMVEAIEMPYVRKTEIGINAGQAPRRLVAYMKSKTIFGEKDGTGTDYQAAYNADPALGWKWSIGLCNIVPGALSSCYVRVSIKYYVQFTLLNEVVRS